MKRIVPEMPPLVTGPWKLEDLRSGKLGYPKNGLKVFTCFHCGGGSSMGYRLAGYDVIGGVEIDTEMMSVYRANHGQSSLSFCLPIQDFVRMPTIPDELNGIDVLDGSPPCSSFSMAGEREDGWTEKKMFREGQTEQVLDDLFFHFIALADRIRPRVVIAENVKGLVLGKAKGYVRDIFAAFERAGYSAQLFVLNSSTMGVPQKRERTFFIARKNDLGLPKLSLAFSEPLIPVSEAWMDQPMVTDERFYMKKDSKIIQYWFRTMPGRSMAESAGGSNFNNFKVAWNAPAMTVTASAYFTHPFEPRKLTPMEYVRLQSFPDDFDFMGSGAQYVCGMSVPPLMMQRVSSEVARQLLLPTFGNV